MVWGDGGLEEGGGFDHCCDEAGCEVPFDVAVEEPDAWREGGVNFRVMDGWMMRGGRD